MSFKVFDKWDLEEVKIEDQGLVNYVCLDEILVPHTMGRHVKRQFAKSRVSIVERLMNKIMRTERNSGKKNKAYNIVKDSMDIINKRSKQNPLQILVKAVENTAPREETTKSSICFVPLKRPGSPKLESKNLTKIFFAKGCGSVHIEPKILPSQYFKSCD